MAYNQDLAYIHDEAFSDTAQNAATTLVQLLRTEKIRKGLVIDLGCGSGVLAEKITCAGYDVLGIDISNSMLKLARKRAPRARFVKGSVFNAKLRSCVAVTAIGECVNYLLDSSAGDRLANLFSRIHRALLPGGIFLFDFVHSSPAGPVISHACGKDWAILIAKETDARKRLLTRRMTIFRRIGGAYRRTEEAHSQKLYPVVQVERKLKQAGFSLTRLTGYGDEAFRPGRAGFVAGKKRASRLS